ncbi:uncharacterized protein LOC129981963 [Argiope bruennichi]|uniref:Uncharacterized protein n=1 Tax=Argiope bruennichi TaxID=94029 RepID=A0A8T0G3Q4_ARGBR|nr:uncharacterized protein LOC129981963 [Argiope bruennichi]KAF8795873.1 hypothetical protein HNY73_000324 [Argiope bruennichi]
MKILVLLLFVGVATAASIYDGPNAAVEDQVEESLAEFNIRDLLKRIKEHIKKTVDPELLKEKIEKIFGQGSELLDQLLRILKEKGRKKMIILIDELLDDDDDEEEQKAVARGMSDYWQKIKDYFKDLQIDLKEKYAKFGEWVKDVLDKGMEHSKDKFTNIKAIAKEFLKHAKGISKEIASEAGEFFKNYKEELGIVWEEIKERIQEIKNRNQ